MKNAVLFFALCFLSLNLIAADTSTEKLHQLFAEEWEYRLSLSPGMARRFGKEVRGGFRDIRPQAYAAQAIKLNSFLIRLKNIPMSDFTSEDRINYRLFQFQLSSLLQDIQYQTYLFPMEGDTGFYFDLLRLPENTVISSEQDAKFYLETLTVIPKFLSQWRENMQLGIKQGRVMPAIVLVDFDKPLAALIKNNPSEHPLLQPLANIEQVMTVERASFFKAAVAKIVSDKVQPAIKKMKDYLRNVYIPAGRQSIAAIDLPEGADYYQSQINYYTTLEKTAEQIHQLGLKEVARIRKEMEHVIKASGFNGRFAEFIEFLRTDPRFYATDATELLKEAAFIAKKMDGALPKFFTRLPRQPYGVEAVPESIAPRYTTGRYVGAPLDSQRAGNYWVNTYALDKRPLYVLEALTLHEAVPGHHLQSALTKELDGLPNFRRYSYLSAYGEGWALYCEKLGIEAGFYKTAYRQFGRLTYEMWRAIRLVVDTGMHAKGWSRDRAIQFMSENTALSKHNVRTEIDRYIAWPGQALSYKMGEIKIIELRRKAELALGNLFDIRLFHDEVLRFGPVTLDILEQQILLWIDEQQKTAALE